MSRDVLHSLRRKGLLVLSGTSRGQPAPPFQKVATDVIWVGFRIDHAAVRPFIPAGLRLTDDSVGILGIYQAPTGTGLAPYTRGLVAVSLKGEDDPGDGLFVLGNVMDEPAAGLVRRLYSGATHTGTARTWRDGELLRGVASVGGKDWLRAAVRPAGRPKTDLSGVDVFIGQTDRGLVRHADSYVADVDEAEVVMLEITDAAPPVFQAVRPREPLFAIQALRVISSWGEPKPVGQGSASEALSTHLTLIENAGRAAMLVRADGMLVEANAGARALLGAEARSGQFLFAGQPGLRRTICEAIENSRSSARPHLYEPVVLGLRDRITVVAHVLPAAHDDAGEDVAVVLLTDPKAQKGRDPVPTLQAFGLTAAEAKLAALVGGGLGVKGAAESLQISEHTARSTLKSVYEKLQIRKQSELGGLVARLQFP